MFAFFLSGAAGLIYEVIWSKSLGLVFGHTVYANATVLAAFMGGLAAGSAWFGRWSERSSPKVAVYGWIELGVAGGAALSLPGLAAVRAMYVFLYPRFAGFLPLLLASRFFGTFLILFVPTFLMGGTLPILVRVINCHVSQGGNAGSPKLARQVSRLYWVNTLGAFLGTLAAGFLALPALGLRISLAIAIVLNLVAGVIALRITGAFDSGPSEELSSPAQSRKASVQLELSVGASSQRFLLAGFGLVGATALMYEVAWTRMLATILGSSTYSFTLTLATFLLGIVLGSKTYEKWYAERVVHLKTFARLQTMTAFAALLFLVFFRELPRIIPPILRATNQSFGGLVLAQFVTSFLAMMPAAVLLGFTFPAVVVLVAQNRPEEGHPAAAVGRACAANTTGAIAGAIVAGFFLIPRFGSFRVVALAALLNLLLAAALELWAVREWNKAQVANAALLGCTILAGWSSVFYDRALASFGTVLYWNSHSSRLTLSEIANLEDIVFLKDGLNATIAVSRSDSYFALKTNGKVDASNVDTETQLLLADLGGIFHPRPRRVLVIGFGGGMTVSAISRFPEVERIDCIEIEPAVIEAAPFLARLNRGVLRDPRLHIVVDDARSALLTSSEQYDLIISEPSNPWISGIATLYTDEYYAVVRQRLSPGGIFVQWVQGYSLEPNDLKMILATLAPHFADVTLWHSAGADFLVLARTQSVMLDFTRARLLWRDPLLHEDFEALHLTRPESWPVYFSLGNAEVRTLAAGAARNTDDRTLLEYRAPQMMIGKSRSEGLMAAIKGVQTGLLPAELHSAEAHSALEGAAESSLDLGSSRSADYVHALEGEAATPSLELLRGRQALRENRVLEAREDFQLALVLDPHYTKAMYWLAMAKHRAPGDREGDSLLTRILQHDPRNGEALAARTEFAKERGDWHGAAQFQKERIQAIVDVPASEYCRLGEFLARTGEWAAAGEAFRAGIAQDSYSYLCHRGLGEIDRVSGRLQEARKHLEFVVQRYPEAEPNTYVALALVYRGLGHRREAREILLKGRRIFPNSLTISMMTQRD